MDTKDFMPDEAAIASIKTDLQAYEADRQKAHGAVRVRVPVFIILLLIATVLLAYGINDFADPYEQWRSTPHIYLYFGALAALFFLYTYAMKPATDLQASFRRYMLPIVFSFIKDVRYANGATPTSFSRLPKEVVGSFNRQSFDDVVGGSYAGFPFELYEAHLRQKAGKSDSTIFKGVIVAFETVVPFPGFLIATRKSGAVASFFRGFFGNDTTHEITTGIPALDEKYEFRTNNDGAARPLVQGRLAQALQYLAEAWPEKPSRIALHESDGFLLIPVTKNFFELPSIGTPLDFDAHIRPIIAEMASILATVALVRKVQEPDQSPNE